MVVVIVLFYLYLAIGLGLLGFMLADREVRKDVLSWEGAAQEAMRIYRSFPGLSFR